LQRCRELLLRKQEISQNCSQFFGGTARLGEGFPPPVDTLRNLCFRTPVLQNDYHVTLRKNSPDAVVAKS
jgi:hypothetical protein